MNCLDPKRKCASMETHGELKGKCLLRNPYDCPVFEDKARQVMDRPELREKIAQKLFYYDLKTSTWGEAMLAWGLAENKRQEKYYERADQILALLHKDKPSECDHIFVRKRLDLRQCIDCGLEQLRYVDTVEPLRWVNK